MKNNLKLVIQDISLYIKVHKITVFFKNPFFISSRILRKTEKYCIQKTFHAEL